MRNHRFNRIQFQLIPLFAVLTLVLTLPLVAAEFPAIYNSQDAKDEPAAPESGVGKIRLPKGFQVSLFAGEPAVQNPIAIAFDDRGRLWVAENYTYAETKLNFDLTLRDRIVIYEDIDQDGRFDKRTVFADNLQRLTSIEIGFGGVWATCAPNLLFIPDRNGDDIPDGPAVVELDGWNDSAVRHNIVNGLRWGPDGWLYGRHGILATSAVGRPGTPENDRTKLNCAIWRYHPTRKAFEVVATGTTNPWGSDWDERGEMFFINTVIGHLFHVIPGAHYKRMYGEDFNTRTYDLIDQHADHYHWDTGKAWTDSRDAKGGSDALGGGHAHSGLMFYLGNNWPKEYRDSLFTINLHGRRLNRDVIEPRGAGFVGKHEPDFLFSSDPWFRVVDLLYGMDGGVYLADWSDVGECHENDGVHRKSGRIYKVTYGKPAKPSHQNLAKLSSLELANLQFSPNEFLVRHARRLLHERKAAGNKLEEVHDLLTRAFDGKKEVPQRLRAMWALHATGGAKQEFLVKCLQDYDEAVRAWAVRLMTDSGMGTVETGVAFKKMVERERSALVRLYLASALQRLPGDQAADLAWDLVTHKEDSMDHNQPLMIWYGIQPLLDKDPMAGVQIFLSNRIPLIWKFIARRFAEDLEKRPDPLVRIIQFANRFPGEEIAGSTIEGMHDALRGWRKAKAPLGWTELASRVAATTNPGLQVKARALGALFGEGRAVEELKAVVLDEKADGDSRKNALRTVIQANPPGLLPMLTELLSNKVTALVALQGLAGFDSAIAASVAVRKFKQFQPEERPQVMQILSSKPVFARVVMEGLDNGTLSPGDISATHARQMLTLNDPEITRLLAQRWGKIRNSPAEKVELANRYKRLLTTERLAKADLSDGRRWFQQVCAACHTLYGEGGKIGPDLTGSGRANLEYLLENIVDPSAIVGADYKMTVMQLKDGRTLNGVLGAQREKTVELQTPSERVTLERAEIISTQASELSMMPDGLLEALNEAQISNLIAYLMHPRQVPLK